MVERRNSFAESGNGLVSVTVWKSDPTQKAGIKVVQKQIGIFVTDITEKGLLDNTQIDIGDKLLSINGKRLRRGETTKEFMQHIAQSRDKVTIVVKKGNSPQKRVPVKKRKSHKIVEKDKHRLADGSFDYRINPTLDKYQKAIEKDNDDKDQIRIRATKILGQDGGGLAFKLIDGMLFVSGICVDSIFKDTQLDLGDRIASVNDVNFMSYADASYAKTLLRRAKGECELIVEKGWDKFRIGTDVDDCHDKPSKDYMLREKDKSSDAVTNMLDKIDKEKQALRERQARRSSKKAQVTISDDASLDEGELSPRSVTSFARMSQGSFSNGLRFQQHKGDYVCVTIQKKSEIDPGIKFKKREGKIILSKVPQQDAKRIPVGTHVFAINGISAINTATKAREIMDKTMEEVVLFINFERLVLSRPLTN